MTSANLTTTTNTVSIGTAAYVVTSGNVGIGTSSPNTKLDVAGPIRSYNSKFANGSTGTNLILRTNSVVGEVSALTFYSTFATGADVGPRRSADITSGYSTGTWGNEYLSFNVGTGGGNDNANTTFERVRITGSGNVGIGNTSPDAKLTVTGTANVSGNVVIGGTLAITGNTTLSSNVAVTGSLIVNGAIHYSTNSYTFSNSTARANVDIFDTTVFRTAEYLVQVTDTTTTPRSYQVTKLAVVHDNTTPYSTEYSTIFTNSLMGTFDVNITSTSFQLRFTPSTANCVIKLSRTAVVV